MSLELRRRIFAELDSLVLIDPHTHINPLQPASQTLADILGYHYYTELAHSAGMAKARIEEPGLAPRDKVARLIANLGPIENTIQHSWFVEIAQKLLGFQGDSIGVGNWEELYDLAERKMSAPTWADEVLEKSKLEAVFLTNEFDDPLVGFDTERYIPCLRTDDLVFHLAKVEVVERLERATGTSVRDAASLRDAIACLFTHFKANGARACAISLPPDFAPTRVSAGRAQTAVDACLNRGLGASEADRRAAANFVFWTLAEFCAEYRLPFDLMIGVNRGVYAGGVHQGRDLYDSRVSLIQYKELFNTFKKVVFPISVLASVTNQELTSYAWIFPNVVTNGHWWYSNTPSFIEHDLAARLEATPRTKQIGYYSDMYKLEFGLPKFAMYKRILAKTLAERFVIDRDWSESRAIDFGKQVLRGNVETLFGFQGEPWTPDAEQAPIVPVQFSRPLATAAVVAAVGLAAADEAAFDDEVIGQDDLAAEPPATPEWNAEWAPSPVAAIASESLDESLEMGDWPAGEANAETPIAAWSGDLDDAGDLDGVMPLSAAEAESTLAFPDTDAESQEVAEADEAGEVEIELDDLELEDLSLEEFTPEEALPTPNAATVAEVVVDEPLEELKLFDPSEEKPISKKSRTSANQVDDFFS